MLGKHPAKTLAQSSDDADPLSQCDPSVFAVLGEKFIA
jgi:hypothetical protein